MSSATQGEDGVLCGPKGSSGGSEPLSRKETIFEDEPRNSGEADAVDCGGRCGLFAGVHAEHSSSDFRELGEP